MVKKELNQLNGLVSGGTIRYLIHCFKMYPDAAF